MVSGPELIAVGGIHRFPAVLRGVSRAGDEECRHPVVFPGPCNGEREGRGAHRLLWHTAEEAPYRPAVSWPAGLVVGDQAGEAIERFRAGVRFRTASPAADELPGFR
ncbi:hypothetical protein GCM10010254_22060 [Streptomyces chromofuscus]|nr:hypothetical protein GCM10010254_22060 [Streptomyces chromofuscus]